MLVITVSVMLVSLFIYICIYVYKYYFKTKHYTVLYCTVSRILLIPSQNEAISFFDQNGQKKREKKILWLVGMMKKKISTVDVKFMYGTAICICICICIKYMIL